MTGGLQHKERSAFGQELTTLREKCGLSVRQLADATKVPGATLSALESGDFEKLPATVFVRGFIRSYAKAVGGDPEALVEAYTECAGQKAPAVAIDPVVAVDVPDTAKREQVRQETAPEDAMWAHINDPTPKRGAVTLAVVVLVIIATLTMSYLLQSPDSDGDGVTEAPSAVETWHS